MLNLGRAVQEGTVVQGQGVSRLGPSRDKRSGVESHGRHLETANPEVLQRALEVLNSETEYSTILSGVIDGFYEAVKGKRENVDLCRRLELLEERLEKLELPLTGNKVQKKTKKAHLIG